jgi:hypothetical protein
MRRFLLAALIALLTLLPTAVTAHHPQTMDDNGSPATIAFDHRGGNAWWVEVNVTTSADPPHWVYARAEKGTFQPLTLRSWGNWAGSFNVPAGQRVQFYAAREHPSGRFDEWKQHSCFFTHPAGVEQCDPGSTDPSTFAFRAPGGNANWEQVYVDSNRPVKTVWMTVDDVQNAPSFSLTKRSWGAWATAANVPQGSTVRFAATNGAEGDRSICYRWTQATPTDCAPTYGPTPIAPFMTRFDHKGGNEWWVEVKIGPMDPNSVVARDDGGPWTPLTMRSWGNWAGSFHIEPGHKVQFRANFVETSQSVTTTTSYDSCWFTHPQGLSPDGAQICGNTRV